MEKTEIKKILKFYKNLNPSTQLNINDREVIEVWCDVFMEYSYEQVRNAGVLTYRGEAKARLEQKLQNQNRGKKYDKQSSYGW